MSESMLALKQGSVSEISFCSSHSLAVYKNDRRNSMVRSNKRKPGWPLIQIHQQLAWDLKQLLWPYGAGVSEQINEGK